MSSEDETPEQRIARRKRRRATDSSSIAPSAISSPAVILLVIGVFFCLLDVVFIANYIIDGTSSVHQEQQQHQQQTPRVPRGNSQTLSIPEWQTIHDKGPIAQLVQEATGSAPDAETLESLPTVQQVANMYGREPKIWGLDSCERFQNTGNPVDHFISTAGTFNTGTNLMAELLIANCYMPKRRAAQKGDGVRWQVVWGKHTPVFNETVRQTHRTYNDSFVTADNMFPIVTIRDPFQWMQSMCRHPYSAEWDHDDTHCPNLIDANVNIQYAAFLQQHESLIHFWNEWYQDYITAEFPRLIVRFEDVVFHPKEITQKVCECAGGKLKARGFKYIVDSAKKGAAHGTDKTSYTDAIIRYGRETGRYKGMEQEDLTYATNHVDPNLMKWFNYQYPPKSLDEATS